jgi:hypothetical protein
MPKFALANDLWVGKRPVAFEGMSEGALMLLPLARAFIKRINCLCDSGKYLKVGERIKGFVGNAAVFPQADGGKVLLSLPPTKEALAQRLIIAFTGTDTDLKKAWLVPGFQSGSDCVQGRVRVPASVQQPLCSRCVGHSG